MKKTLILLAFVYAVISAPSVALAFDVGQLIDPACFFACEESKPKKTTTTTVARQTTAQRAPAPTPAPITVVNNNYNYNNTNGNGSYHDYDNDYRSRPNYGSLVVSCYANTSVASVDDRVTWYASLGGGDGDYSVRWSGSEGLSGSGTSASIRYDYEGTKHASIRVSSDGQTVTRNCSNIQIYDYDNNNNRYYDNNYDYNYNDSLYVSCSVNTNFAPVNNTVVWEAYASGGNGNYRYSWSGTDRLNGSGRTVDAEYHSAGVKNASVTVYSNGRSVTQMCSNTVTIGVPNQYGYNSGDMQVACYADKLSVTRGALVKWSVEAVGGSGNYTYTWTGSEGLSGSGTTVATSYDTTGVKTASVVVRASNGQTVTQFCGNNVTVKNPGTAVAKVTPKEPSGFDDLSASSLFSVKNIPWGWVMVLVMLVMMGAIIFLIFTRNKK